jgi:ParB-like chromosome segregation protein Spo0J
MTMTTLNPVAPPTVHGIAVHPAAGLFPMMDWPELLELEQDIREHGLHEPIMLVDGAILDGRNRWIACARAGVQPRTRTWDGASSPTAYVISLNLHRRHLTVSQRSACAAEALPLFEAEAKARQQEHGGTAPGRTATLPAKLPEVFSDARDDAGAAFGVSGRNVSKAKRLKETQPDLHEQVKSGERTLEQATREANARAQDVADAAVRRHDTTGQLARQKMRYAWAAEVDRMNQSLLTFTPDMVVPVLELHHLQVYAPWLRRLADWAAAFALRLEQAAEPGPHVLPEGEDPE